MKKGNNKLLVVVAAIIGLILFSALYLILAAPDNDNNEQNAETTVSRQEQPAGETPEMNMTGGYQDYENGIIEQTEGTKVLFFHAPWCPQCRELEDDILANGVPEDVTIFKVDYDSSQQLRQQYGVTIQTTLVKVDDQGNSIGKYVAYDDPTLDAVKDNLL